MAKKKERTLQELSQAWLNSKAAEETAKEARYQIEEAIAALLPGSDEGTESIEDHGLKISVTRKFNRTIDTSIYHAVEGKIPVRLSPVRFKAELDLKLYRAIEKANPEVFEICQEFITVKPAKVLIKVEKVKE